MQHKSIYFPIRQSGCVGKCMNYFNSLNCPETPCSERGGGGAVCAQRVESLRRVPLPQNLQRGGRHEQPRPPRCALTLTWAHPKEPPAAPRGRSATHRGWGRRRAAPWPRSTDRRWRQSRSAGACRRAWS